MRGAKLNSESLRDLAVEALEDIKGHQILALDVQAQTDITDYMVIATGATRRQVKALVDKVLEKAKAASVDTIGVEGLESLEWVLIDFADVVVHVMLPDVREFYELERLWTVNRVNLEESQGSAGD